MPRGLRQASHLTVAREGAPSQPTAGDPHATKLSQEAHSMRHAMGLGTASMHSGSSMVDALNPWNRAPWARVFGRLWWGCVRSLVEAGGWAQEDGVMRRDQMVRQTGICQEIGGWLSQ